MAQYDTSWFEKGLAELEITLNEKQIEQFLTSMNFWWNGTK